MTFALLMMFGTTWRKASSHAFLSKSPLAWRVCECRERAGSLQLTLTKYLLAVGREKDGRTLGGSS